VELLIAAAIVIVVLGVVSANLVSYLGYTGAVRTDVNVQTELRRTMELITQDLRNASFGMIASQPYPAETHSISLLQMDETSAYQVLGGNSSGDTSDFYGGTAFTVNASRLDWDEGDTVLLLSPQYTEGTALEVSATPSVSGNPLKVTHSDVNTLCWDPRMLAVKAEAIGYKYDSTDDLLLRATGLSASEVQPVAFNVDAFTLGYIGSDGTSYSTLASVPAGVHVLSLAVTLKMSGTFNGQRVNKTLTSYVEMPQQFTLTSTPLQFKEAASSASGITCN
jgi:type II secretory pathway pseudopilin PulG